MMANLQAVARAQFGNRAGNPAHFAKTLNQQICGRFGTNRYATMFWAEYDSDTTVLSYLNAGHPSPILIRASGTIERLNSDGFPIGMFADAPYTSATTVLKNRMVALHFMISGDARALALPI